MIVNHHLWSLPLLMVNHKTLMTSSLLFWAPHVFFPPAIWVSPPCLVIPLMFCFNHILVLLHDIYQTDFVSTSTPFRIWSSFMISCMVFWGCRLWTIVPRGARRKRAVAKRFQQCWEHCWCPQLRAMQQHPPLSTGSWGDPAICRISYGSLAPGGSMGSFLRFCNMGGSLSWDRIARYFQRLTKLCTSKVPHRLRRFDVRGNLGLSFHALNHGKQLYNRG